MIEDFEIDPMDPAYDVQPKKALTPVPKGEYRLRTTSAEFRQLKEGIGVVLDVRFEIQEGPHEGRRLSDGFAISHRTLNDWVQSSKVRLVQMMRSMRLNLKLNSQNVDELVGYECLAQIGHKKRGDSEHVNYWFEYQPLPQHQREVQFTGGESPF